MNLFYPPSFPFVSTRPRTRPPRRPGEQQQQRSVPAPTPPNENNLCADTVEAEGGGGRRRGLRSWLTKSESLALSHFSFFSPSSFPPHSPDKQTSPQSEKDKKVARLLRSCAQLSHSCETPPLPRWMVSTISLRVVTF